MATEIFEFSDETYRRLDAAGLTPLAVLDVLYGGAVVRRHTGAVLQIAGRDKAGMWLVVALIESSVDDHYIVAGARALDDDEITAIAQMRGEQQ